MMNMGAASNSPPSAGSAGTTAVQQTFAVLSVARTDVCSDMGDEQAIHRYMNALPVGARLQGSCCTPMDYQKFATQIAALRKYAAVGAIPSDPYDTPAASAQQMLGFYDNIKLTAPQQTVFDAAASKTDDKGWCCCQCWAWYTHAGLAKYLLTTRGFTAQQIVDVTNLQDCCGGA